MDTRFLLPGALFVFFLFSLGVRSFVTWGIDPATWKEEPGPETEGRLREGGESRLKDDSER